MKAWVLVYFLNMHASLTPLFSPALASKQECERVAKTLNIGQGYFVAPANCVEILVPKQVGETK